MAIRAVFAENLKYVRALREISQETLALKAGVERSYIGLLERQRSSPTIDMIEKLAKVLRVQPYELLRPKAQFDFEMRPVPEPGERPSILRPIKRPRRAR